MARSVEERGRGMGFYEEEECSCEEHRISGMLVTAAVQGTQLHGAIVHSVQTLGVLLSVTTSKTKS